MSKFSKEKNSRANLKRHESGQFIKQVFYFLFGRRLASDEEQRSRIGILTGVPVLGLDALASAAYGPEAALTVLIPLGIAGVAEIGPIMLIIVTLLLLVTFSYRQTINAYPNGGGSYTVAKENLGLRWGTLASAALTVDYVLNVAVAISAGIGAVASVFPSLMPYTLELCLALLAILTLVNLRGVRETGVVFLVPTYLFVFCLFAAVTIGIAKTILSSGHPQPIIAPPTLPNAASAASLWLLVRAFANGCTAMTGIEAVSNAVPLFRDPATKLARRTLMLIIGTLVLLLAGIAFLCRAYQIGATEPASPHYQSVLSQLLGAVAGHGWFYHVSMAAIFLVLALSANTSFAGFPRVCRLLALDEYLPEIFARRGRRLVYNSGIATLAILAAILLIAFRGITNGLIPLFAIGALLAFTLSQAGMVGHWRKRLHEPGAKSALIINTAGALATGTTVLVVMVSKFLEGAWIILVLVPTMIFLLRRLRVHERYEKISGQSHRPLNFQGLQPPVVVVPVFSWTRAVEKALRFSMLLSSEVRAIQVVKQDVPQENMAERWDEFVEAPARQAGLPPPKLNILHSKYRELLAPVVNYIQQVASQFPDRTIAVVVPEKVERRWYYLLSFATLLKAMLLLRGRSQIVVISTPWYARRRAT
jgi:amino acid transporter